jgi:hypothetical protein
VPLAQPQPVLGRWRSQPVLGRCPTKPPRPSPAVAGWLGPPPLTRGADGGWSAGVALWLPRGPVLPGRVRGASGSRVGAWPELKGGDSPSRTHRSSSDATTPCRRGLGPAAGATTRAGRFRLGRLGVSSLEAPVGCLDTVRIPGPSGLTGCSRAPPSSGGGSQRTKRKPLLPPASGRVGLEPRRLVVGRDGAGSVDYFACAQPEGLGTDCTEGRP